MFSSVWGTHSMLNAHMVPIIGMTEGLFIFPSWVCVAVVTLFANSNQFLYAAAQLDSVLFEARGTEGTLKRLQALVWKLEASYDSTNILIWRNRKSHCCKISLSKPALFRIPSRDASYQWSWFSFDLVWAPQSEKYQMRPHRFTFSVLHAPSEEEQKWIWILPPHNLGSCKSCRYVPEALSETAWRLGFFL